MMNVKVTHSEGAMEFDVPEGRKLELVMSLLHEVADAAQNIPDHFDEDDPKRPRNWQGLREHNWQGLEC